MRCPHCDGATMVVDCRPLKRTNTIRRRRECLGCGQRTTTKEVFDDDVKQVQQAAKFQQQLRQLIGA